MKVGYYCIGNFAPLLYHVSKFSDYESSFYVQNFKGKEFFEEISDRQTFYYQYENFNEIFKNCPKGQCPLNYNTIYQADKAHYKRSYSGKKISHVIDAFFEIFNLIFNKDKPDYIFFPIIESLDAMVVYELARYRGIKTIVYSHSRVLPLSFLSPNKFEEFPEYFYKNLSESKHSISLLERLANADSRIADQMLATVNSISSEDIVYRPVYDPALLRLCKNIQNQFFKERHNACLSNWTKFLVFIEKIVVPIGRLVQTLIDIILLKPAKGAELVGDFVFFPLHFSPESSINTPAPFYIDQERVVDEILLNDPRMLVLKEHPALYGKRPLRFYRNILRKPNVYFVDSNHNIHDLISRCETVVSVTGTVVIEAFFKNKSFVQLGSNYFSGFIEWCKREGVKEEDRQLLLVNILVNNASCFLVAPHSNRNNALNEALFSTNNLTATAEAIDEYIRYS